VHQQHPEVAIIGRQHELATESLFSNAKKASSALVLLRFTGPVSWFMNNDRTSREPEVCSASGIEPVKRLRLTSRNIRCMALARGLNRPTS
jgi:hypothetical protein